MCQVKGVCVTSTQVNSEQKFQGCHPIAPSCIRKGGLFIWRKWSINEKPGGRGWEPHVAGEEGRVERHDDGARLHQGDGQVGHCLESGEQKRWVKNQTNNNKFISNLRKINLFLVCMEKKSPCWWISTESSAHPPLPRVLGQKARGGADITRGGSRSQHTRSSSRMLKRYSNKDDKYSRVSDCFRRSLAASKWKCHLCTLPRVQRWTRWGKV